MTIYNTPIGKPKKVREEPAPMTVPITWPVAKPKPKKKEKVPA